MKSGVHFLSPGQCLVSWLRDQLTQGHGHLSRDFEDTWIVLPTTRLAGNLAASLVVARAASSGSGVTGSGASIIAPRAMNLDGFLTAAADALAQSGSKAPSTRPAPRVINPEMPEALLHALIKRRRHKHIDPVHAHELAHLIGTAVDNNLPLTNLGQAAAKILREEIYHSEEHLCALGERIDSVQATILDFLDFLRANNLETMEMRRARLADGLADIGAKAPWRHLVIAGFTSMVPAHMRMLRQLSGRDDVTIVLTRPFDDVSPMARLARQCGFKEKIDAANTPGASVSTWIARNREEEVRKAIDLATDLIGTSSSASVAILVPDETTYEPYLRKALEERATTGVNIAATKPLSRAVTGSWFLHMGQFARLRTDECLEETRQAAAAFLTHPLHGCEEAVRSCIAAAVAASPDIRSIPREIARTRDTDPEVVAAASAMVDRAMAMARALGQTSCLAILERELDALDPSSSGETARNPDAAKADAGESDARAEIRQILHDLRFLRQRLPVNAETILELFVQRVKSGAIRDRGEPLTGLQVLTLAEARHVPFQAAVIIGCNEGVFPRALPKDRLLDQFILRKLGLPTWEDLEAIEDTTFHLLRARLTRLVMTCAQKDASRPLVPSRYIELMKTLRGIKPLVYAPEHAKTGVHTIIRGQPEVSGRIMDPSAHASDIATALSASSLASLVACPYKYALDRQAASPPPDYESTTALRKGTWLHDAIKSALTGYAPVGDSAADARALESRLAAASVTTIPPELRETGILAHLESWSWPRLAAFSASNWSVAPGSSQRGPVMAASESRFEIDLDGRQFIGAIDRFEDLGPIWLLIDYKASAAPSRTDLATGVSPQLAIYAHAISRIYGLPLDQCVAGHFEILKGNWVIGFHGNAAKDHAIRLGLRGARARNVPLPEDAINAAVAMMRWRQAAGAEPAWFPDKTACGYCPHSNICRREDMAATAWFANPFKSRALLQRLQVNAKGKP